MTERQYVVFKLGEGEFGIEIMNVREIVPYEESISIPDTPNFIEGIINHRGSVIPIINLKKRFSIGEYETTKDTRIIIITLEDREIGFIVDEASQTVRLNSDEIDQAPSIVGGIDKKYITGVGKLGEKRLLILIDLERILSESEIKQVQSLEV